MEKLEPLCTIGWNVNGAAAMENGMEVPQKIKNRITYDPTTPLLDMYPIELKTISKRYVHSHVHYSIVHNS